MLTAAEISAMREVEESALSSTCIISRYTLSGDGMGGSSESWVAVGTVNCDIWQIFRTSIRERNIGGQPTQVGDWYITIPYNTSITAKDRCVIGGRTYEVTFVPTNSSWLTALRVEARSLNEELRN
jgi:head-tail adaptor